MLELFSFKGNEVRFVGGKPVANDVAQILGYADPSATVSKKVSPKYKGVATVETPGGVQSVTVLDIEGVKELLSKSRKLNQQKQKIADLFNIDLSVISHDSVETETIKIIQHSFSHLPSSTQFCVSGYRVDLYFPFQRIAVECDEFNHAGYNETTEKERQNCIIKILECSFVRYNPNEKDFNIGTVINRIMSLVYGV